MVLKMKCSLQNELDELFTKALSEKVIPGAVVAVSHIDQGLFNNKYFYNYGYLSNICKEGKVTKETYFDLASLTKPLVTSLCLFNLAKMKLIGPQSTLVELLPFCKIPEDKKFIQLWQLMSHCSGLPAHRPYFIRALGVPLSERKDFFVQSILAEKLEYVPASKHVYSDLGYILLGLSIEQLTQQNLDEFFKYILRLFVEKSTLQFKPQNRVMNQLQFGPTEICPWTRKMLCGVVHDDNCRVMGGVAGHAGLFGTAGGVLDVCSTLCEVWQGSKKSKIVSQEILRSFLTRRGKSTWTCGFDTPSQLLSSSGSYFGPASVGHLGFTGTSFWIDLERGLSVVVLTNRVHPTRKNDNIRKLRPQIHDIIMKKLL